MVSHEPIREFEVGVEVQPRGSAPEPNTPPFGIHKFLLVAVFQHTVILFDANI